MKKPHNDNRAGFTVTVFPDATNVKLPYRGYVISLAADGQETIIFNESGDPVEEFAATGAKQVAISVAWIDRTLDGEPQ